MIATRNIRAGQHVAIDGRYGVARRSAAPGQRVEIVGGTYIVEVDEDISAGSYLAADDSGVLKPGMSGGVVESVIDFADGKSTCKLRYPVAQ